MPSSAKKVGILTIGTEITTGQITNTNAAWLAEQCINLRLDVVLHASVADTEKDIIDLLQWAEERCDVLIMSGGLGPTRDDLTRNAVSAWMKAPLELDASSWQRVQDRLASYGLKTPQSNKQQSLFPKGARVLPNHHGTADAFSFSHGSILGYCLPGVPVELHALWREYLGPELTALTQDDDTLHLMRWHTIGKGEGDVAELVEATLEGSGLTTGFRAHFPYIETKVWCWGKDLLHRKHFLDAVDVALEPWLVCKGDTDIAKELVALIPPTQKAVWHDATSDGYLTQRLKKALAERVENANTAPVLVKSIFGTAPMDAGIESDWVFILHPVREDGSWTVEWRCGRKQGKQEFQSPYRLRTRDRKSIYAAEKSLWHWLQVLGEKK